MLDDTLVLWGGEFGRTQTPKMATVATTTPTAFTMWIGRQAVSNLGSHLARRTSGATTP